MMHLSGKFLCLLMLLPATVCANAQSLGGTVTDCEGRQPLAGVSVRIAGTSGGTATDANGQYHIGNIGAGLHTLEFSFVGMASVRKEVKAERGRQSVLNVCMDEGALGLGEIVVAAKSPVQHVRETSFNVIALDAKVLHNTSLDLSHALDRISGVKLRETGGMGSNAQISLNGFSGRHVKVFMDGLPMEGFGSSFRLNNIPVQLADRIEVYKGVIPVELGADALGGAINIVTSHRRRTYVDASYSYGSFNTHKSNLSVGLAAKNGFFVRFNAYQNYSDNSYRVKTRLLNLETNSYSAEEYWFRRFHDNYHNEAVVVKAGVAEKPWADRLQFEFTVSREKQDIQNANLMKIVYGGRERSGRSLIPGITYEKRNLLVENLNLRLAANAGLARNNNTDTLARQYNWRGEYRAKGFKGEGQYAMGEYDNRNATLAANLHYRPAEKHHFALNNLLGGFSRKATDAAANSETSTAATFMRRTNLKNVSGLSYRFEPSGYWNAAAFCKRYDVMVRGPINVSATSTASYEEQERTFGTNGYGLAATYRPTASLQLKASYEKAYRLPSENELFGDESLETGDAALRPENSHNLNLNVSYDRSFGKVHSVYLDAGLIYRDTRDYIRRQIEQRYGGAYYTNHGRVRNYGIDLEARYFYGRRFSVGGNFTYQDIRNMERYGIGGRELIYYKDRMPNVPYLFGNVDANYNLHDCFGKGNALSFGYNMRYVHSFFRDWESEGGDIIIPRQLSHDLDVLYSLRDGRYNIGLEVRNVADEMLYDNYSLQKPGRSFLIKARCFLYKQ
ncbi:MAG: TonB-dependent receptor [Tannerellaceae bacterium]|jgi:outer membrane receptor protein involved in Fe transport|nr:TonB-dependent receptor [Tannerellaceae bacterium]